MKVNGEWVCQELKRQKEHKSCPYDSYSMFQVLCHNIALYDEQTEI